MTRCSEFFKEMCRLRGVSQRTVKIKYPRGIDNKSVYGRDDIIVSGHCIYCARAKALMDDPEYKIEILPGGL